jgi:hypothetical protein
LVAAILAFFFQVNFRASADELSGNLAFPGSRYTKSSPNEANVAHWDSPITLQVLRLTDNKVQLDTLGTFQFLSRAAGAELSVWGFPDAMFAQGNAVGSTTNLLIFGYDKNLQNTLVLGGASAQSSAVDLSNSTPEIGRAFRAGLKKQTDGCLAQWDVNSAGAIDGYVLAVGNWLSSEQKLQCVDRIAPSAFGVLPAVSTYDLKKFDPSLVSNSAPLFSDDSEIILELQAAATCRETLHHPEIKCPEYLMLAIFSHHADMLNAFKKQ